MPHVWLQVGSENLTMKEALKGMKEQAARMAVEAQQAAAAAAEQREEADTALASVNSELEAERKRITALQVPFWCPRQFQQPSNSNVAVSMLRSG